MRNMLFTLIALLLTSYAGVASAAPGDERWVVMNPELPGTNDTVYAMVQQGDYLYIGGSFTFVRNIEAKRVARLHIPTGTWEALGEGVNDYVFALALDANGNLYAGGDFTEAGGVAANRAAKWDGTSWSALGDGVSGSFDREVSTRIWALAADSYGSVYAGGDFTWAGDVAANGVAKWNGTEWQGMESGMDGPVEAFAFDASGELYVGGMFYQAGDVSASCIARWDGVAWNAVGGGMGTSCNVDALAIDTHGDLYAGGHFTTAGSTAAQNVAKWDGVAWSAVGSGVEGPGLPPVRTLACDPDGVLYAGGDFTAAGGVTAWNIAKWDGTAWNELGNGMDDTVLALVFGTDDRLYVGGYFSFAGEVAANNIATWDGIGWETFGSGMNRMVTALAIDPQEGLYVGGLFLTIGDVAARRVAKWDGISWGVLGRGLYGDPSVLITDADGALYAGNDIVAAEDDGAIVNRVVRWDGTSWVPLGRGMEDGSVFSFPTISALAIDSDGVIYAGGNFTMADDVIVNHVARWDGSAWGPLGEGMNKAVSALAVAPDGTLYAGGSFTTAGGIAAHHIAQWNGSVWGPLGTGMDDQVTELVIDANGKLYGGGRFKTAGDAAANGVATWDGVSWSSLGSGVIGGDPEYVSRGIEALALDANGDLYAGGNFTVAGGIAARNIAKWNGVSWSALGSGINAVVYALAVDLPGNLYAGGIFTMAGDEVSPFIVKYLSADVDVPEGPDDDALLVDADVELDESVDSVIDDTDSVISDEPAPVDTDTAKLTGGAGCGCSLAF